MGCPTALGRSRRRWPPRTWAARAGPPGWCCSPRRRPCCGRRATWRRRRSRRSPACGRWCGTSTGGT
eukprot:1173114-Prorocentrum_minimum.AAC.1